LLLVVGGACACVAAIGGRVALFALLETVLVVVVVWCVE
jgi:hypothetical protein